jgi:hypothetical protein
MEVINLADITRVFVDDTIAIQKNGGFTHSNYLYR